MTPEATGDTLLQVTDGAPVDPNGAPRSLLRRAVSRLLAGRGKEGASLIGVLLLGTLVVALHVRADPRLSPIDELQHVDYVVKASQLSIPRSGETDGAVARREAACRGIEAPFTPPPCAASAKAKDSAYPENAVDTAASDSPLYYVLTGLAARAAQTVFHLRSIVTVARLLGILWMAAGVVFLWLAMKELTIGLVTRTAVGALIVTTPVVVHSSATVTSDAVLLLGGSAALYSVLLWERRQLSGWIVLAVAALCGLAKTPCLLAVAAAAVYLIVRGMRRHAPTEVPSRSRGELLRMALVSSALAVGTTLAWLVIVNIRAIHGAPSAPSSALFQVDHLKLGQVLAQTDALLSPVAAPPVLAPLQSQLTFAIVAILNVLLVGAAFGGAMLSRAGSRAEGIGTSAAALMLAGGPAFVIAIYLSQHQVIPVIPHRYGLALLAVGAAALSSFLVKSWVRWTVVALAVFTALYTLVRVAIA